MPYTTTINFEGRDYQITITRNPSDDRIIQAQAKKEEEAEFLPIIEMIVDEFALVKDERVRVKPTVYQIDLANSELILFKEDRTTEVKRFDIKTLSGLPITRATDKFILKDKEGALGSGTIRP